MQQINLYHPIFRKQEKKFSAVAMLQAGAVIIAGIIVLYGVQLWQYGSQKSELQQLSSQQQQLAKRLDDVSKRFGRRGKSKLLEQRVRKLEKQLAARARVEEILRRGLFSNTTGYSNYFIAFSRQHVSGMWLTGLSITGGGEEMRLQGRSIDPALVPRYVQKLSLESPLAGTEFEIFQMIRKEKENSVRALPYIDFLIKTAKKEDRGSS